VHVPHQVKALGQTRVRLNRAYDRLCAPPLDNLDFVLADVSLKMTRRFTNYSGDISGRMIGALNDAQPVLGRHASLLSRLLVELPKYQKRDGHFGADQDLNKLVRIRDMPILWGNGRLLLGLSERCLAHPDPTLLAVARRLGEYVVSTRPYYGKKANFQHVGGVAASGYTTCYPSMIDGLVALGRVTGVQRFDDEARFIAHLSLLDKVFHRHHSHGRLITYRGMLDLDRRTGTHDFVDAVRAGCAEIARHYVFPTGGVPEYFDRAYHRDEGCSEADWIRVNFLLWRATGDTTYLDVAEHVLRNHMLPMQFRHGGFGHRDFASLSVHGKSFPYAAVMPGGADSYWCCSMHCTQLLADTARWAVLPAGRDVYCTWLAESQTTIQVDNHEVIFVVRNPARDTWTVSIQAKAPTAVTLHLRVPGWAHAIRVDGKPVRVNNGWATITRTWNGTTVLAVTLPDELRLAGAYTTETKQNEPVRLFAGPDLFCLPDNSVQDGVLDTERVPVIYLAAHNPTDGVIPVVIVPSSGARQNARLVPMSRRPLGGAHYLFDVRRISGAEFRAMRKTAHAEHAPGQCVEMAFACDDTCDIYLNGTLVHHQLGWQNGDQVIAFSDQPTNVVALVVSSKSQRPGLIGMIRYGSHVLVTQPAAWSAAPVTGQLTTARLATIESAADGTIKLDDLGALGVAPWKYIPGHFLGTGAHWIWPTAGTHDSEQRWLLQLELPSK